MDWTRLLGSVLDGGYQLEAILSADTVGATFKVRVLGDSSANAIAKLFGVDPANACEQAELWESTRELRDTNLLIPLGAGQTQTDGATVAYLIVRRPDEILEEVIRERPLNQQEAGEVLMAAIHGLEELHSHGFVHRCLSPGHIVATGEAIKLSLECVGRTGLAFGVPLREPKYMALESTGQNVTPEADVWCLGATLIEIFSQQDCAEDCMDQAAKLPVPFDSIARRCLDPDPETRLKLGQVEAMLRSNAAPVAEPKKVEVPAPAAVPVSLSASPSIPPRVAEPGAAQIGEARRLPLWMYAAVGAAIVFVLIWLMRPKHKAVPSATHAAVRTAPSSAQPSAWESKTIAPEDAKTVTRAPVATSKPVVPGAQQFVKGQVWRVVMYTYTRPADADSKARWVNQKYPGLNAQTFSPSGESLYLVVAGGRMSRDQAERLRQKVRAFGLPRDSYIQNYQQ